MPFDCATAQPTTRLQSRRTVADDSARLTVDERLENWAATWRYRLRLDDTAGSFEGCYRSPQAPHWDWNVASAPSVLVAMNHVDAQEVELAVCALDIYHHIILKAHYVRRWSQPKCLQVARKAAGDERTRRRGDFGASLLMAKALTGAQLQLPAVVRRTRAVERVRLELGFPVDGIGERPK